MNKRIVKNIIATILYVLAVIFLVYTVWSIVTITEYISELIKQGAIVDVGSQIYDIFNFYMTNGTQYIAISAILAAMGYAIQIIGRPLPEKKVKAEKDKKAEKVEKDEKIEKEEKKAKTTKKADK